MFSCSAWTWPCLDVFCALWYFVLLLFSGNVDVSNTIPPNRNRFGIVHLNVCGLLGKLDLLTLFLEKHNFDIFGVTESLLQESIPSSSINIPGYSFERKDRGQKDGGVRAYVNRTLIIQERKIWKVRARIYVWKFYPNIQNHILFVFYIDHQTHQNTSVKP